MAKDHNITGNTFTDLIIYNDFADLRREANALKVTQTELKDALNHVGYLRSSVLQYLSQPNRYMPPPAP